MENEFEIEENEAKQKVDFIAVDSPYVCLTESQLDTLLTAQEKYNEFFGVDGCENEITDAIIFDAQTFLPAQFKDNVKNFIIFNTWKVAKNVRED